jgi:N6-adenosine-specific RNA methylase IME4
VTLLYARPPFGALKAGAFDLIMADPPWKVEMRSPKGEAKSYSRHYGGMSFADIAALPVGDLAARDAVLFLWAVWPLMLDGGDRHHNGADAAASPIGAIMKAWGFYYATGGVWGKRTRHGKWSFGTGYRARSACEPFLIGIRGRPKNSRGERNLIEGLAREHSRKPDAAFAWCERYLPGARRLELFSRQSRPGWTTWGYEAGKFDPVLAEAA